MSSLVELLKDQKKLEVSHAERLKQTIESTSHPFVSALLEIILHDSMKHASLCQAIIDAESKAPTALDLDMSTAIKLHQSIKQHVRIEKGMIARIERILEQTKEPRYIEILTHFLEDEKRHHIILQRLSNFLDTDTTAYDEYLDLIQKYMVSPP